MRGSKIDPTELKELKKQLIGHLKANYGNIPATAKSMKCTRAWVYLLLKRMALNANDFRPEAYKRK